MLDECIYGTVSEIGDAENISKSFVGRRRIGATKILGFLRL
jgi:hypothetical protein